jgi:hypothetical protein
MTQVPGLAAPTLLEAGEHKLGAHCPVADKAALANGFMKEESRHFGRGSPNQTPHKPIRRHLTIPYCGFRRAIGCPVQALRLRNAACRRQSICRRSHIPVIGNPNPQLLLPS